MKLSAKLAAVLSLVAVLAPALSPAPAAPKIYWRDAVPAGWNGKWPAKYLTVAEKTGYTRTASSTEVLEFLDALRWSSDKMLIINMFTTSLRRTGAAAVLASPRVASPDEAAKSGKTVVYLQGNIHAYEPEAKEALIMLMRDILFGKRKGLLDKLIVIVCPNLNVDGAETLSLAVMELVVSRGRIKRRVRGVTGASGPLPARLPARAACRSGRRARYGTRRPPPRTAP